MVRRWGWRCCSRSPARGLIKESSYFPIPITIAHRFSAGGSCAFCPFDRSAWPQIVLPLEAMMKINGSTVRNITLAFMSFLPSSGRIGQFQPIQFRRTKRREHRVTYGVWGFDLGVCFLVELSLFCLSALELDAGPAMVHAALFGAGADPSLISSQDCQ